MKYACLVYLEEKLFEPMSQAESDGLVNEALDHDDKLRESGHYVSSEALAEVGTATTLRVRDGRLSVTDGPFAETKEQLGGFIIIEATDLDDAIRAASTIPMARLGSIEIRPVEQLQRKPVAPVER
jgi:hypothetical protein